MRMRMTQYLTKPLIVLYNHLPSFDERTSLLGTWFDNNVGIGSNGFLFN